MLIRFSQFDGLLWLLLTLGPLIFLQRSLHFQIQAFLLLATKNPAISSVIFAILFFPGVVLHEFSHFLMAKLLFVRTRRFSLIPKIIGNGQLRLGYVEASASDPVRDTIIGAAPLISGAAFVAYAGLTQLNLSTVLETSNQHGWQSGLYSMVSVIHQPDFFIWFYLVFVISSMMLPSASDRRSWLIIGFWVGLIILLSMFAGAGPWLVRNVAPFFDNVLTSLAIVFGISASVHLILLPIFGFLHFLASRITGLDVR